MKIYLDTNVLIASFVRTHPHHAPAINLLETTREGTLQACIGTHGLAEFYTVITRLPYSPRVQPLEAHHFLDEHIFPYFELVALTETDYRTVLGNATRAGQVGGMIYDALHLCAAGKANCDRIYTFNLRHFRALASKEMEGKITAP